MGRLTPDMWGQARADYEVRGWNMSKIAKMYGCDVSAISRAVKRNGWVQGKNQDLVERKLAAVSTYASVDEECKALPPIYQLTIDECVREQMQMGGLCAALANRIAYRAINLIRECTNVDQLETLSRVHRNLTAAGQKPDQKTTVLVNNSQIAQQGTVQLSPAEAMAEAIAMAKQSTANQ